MVCETAEWKGVEEGAAGGDDYGSFFPQMKPNGWCFDAKHTR